MHLMEHLFSDVEGYPGQNSIVIDAKSKYRTKVHNIISSFYFGRYKNVLFTTLYLVSILRCSKALDHKVGECSLFWFILHTGISALILQCSKSFVLAIKNSEKKRKREQTQEKP